MFRYKKITIAFLLILAISGLLARAASAESVSPGERIRFIAKNRDDSVGAMEGVEVTSTVTVLKGADFLEQVQVENTFKNTIPIKEVGQLVYKVINEPEPGSKVRIDFLLTTNMPIDGPPCIPDSWTKSVELVVGDDVDNSDPTYIQLSRKTPPDAKKETPYQFSPTSSPGTGDTLSIDYNLAQDSLVTILIFDFGGNLIRTLVNNELRNAGANIDIWDGKNDAGEFVTEGGYRFIITAVDSIDPLKVWEVTGEIVVDDTLPIADIDFIKADTPQHGHYTFIGTASDEHIDTYTLECLGGTEPLQINLSQSSVEGDTLGSFNGFLLAEGPYTIRLTVEDFAGNSTVNEMPIIIDRTTNGIKVHINSISKILDLGDEGFIPTPDEPDVWVDEDLPVGSTQIGDWQWNTEIKYSGEASHTDPGGNGTHGHYFIHADRTLTVGSGDNIIQYVYLDPSDPPSQILLQFYTENGDGEHRAYWGYNRIQTGGKSGTASLFYMGRLPTVGKWIRLKIPASTVGVGGKEIKGIAFATYNGKAYWDKTTTSLGLNETQENSWVIASVTMQDNNTDTVIYYSLSRDANLALKVYDKDNNLVTTIFDEFQYAGSHQIVWDGKDSLGGQAPDDTYYFQFSTPDGPIDSNSFALIDGDFSAIPVNPQPSVTDSEGNTYRVDFGNNLVNKYDALNDLLFSISNEQLGVENFNPVALELDINDNLFIVDRNNSKIFKLESNGYYLTELPYFDANAWEDKRITLNNPNAVFIDNIGDMYVADQDGANIIKLAVARGSIDISNITAEIRVPYENSLVYATVPIIGTASARNFASYRVEYGVGDSPSVWTSLVVSSTEVFDEHQPLPGRVTLRGNLATWSAYGFPMGIYTLRLTVYTRDGTQKEDTVKVEVARNIHYSGGTVTSPDGLVVLTIPQGALGDDVELISIKPVSTEDAPEISNPDLTLVGKIYEFRPPGFEFLKPCELKMYYTDSQITGIDENSLKIYRWNPINHSWVYVYADLDTINNVLTTEISEFNAYETYYAIIADPPAAPIIYQPASPTTLKNIIVHGEADPGVKVELFVGGASQGTTDADIDTGQFVKFDVHLVEGNNYLTAQASDPVGNLSPLSNEVLVVVILNQPLEVTSLDFKTSDFSQDFTGDVSIGDTLYMELVGTDTDPASIDATTVTLTSSITDPSGINVQLLETGQDTGIYRGTATVSESSSSGSIGVSQTEVETITVTSDVDPTKQDQVNTTDTEPPPAPTIYSSTHPSLSQDTFEFDLGEWSNKSNSYGATVTRVTETSSTGSYSVRLVNEEEAGDFASYIRSTPFDAAQYPLVSFDYRIPPDVKINLIAYVNGMWKEIVFTDDAKTVETFEEDLYRTIGTIKDAVADDQWHHTEFNLYNMLKNDDPSQTEYIVEELFMADYDLTGWMELVMGQNAQGATYYIDNFIISQGGKSNNSPEFNWTPNDAGVTDYSYVLDGNPDTIPDEISEGSSTSVTYTGVLDGIWYFHLRSMDGGNNWGPANHHWIMIDTTGPTADTPQPEDSSSSGSLEVKLHITDASGSGVNPDTISLQINEAIYDINSGGISYDSESETLTFSLWKVAPSQQPWPDGSTVQATLLAADDFAGNPFQEAFSWSWIVDYSELVGGYLSLLTTQGGHTPSWSSDGNQIVFMSERSGNQDIWVIDSDDYAELNGTIHQLTFDTGNDHHPAWSPVDDRIAFVSDRNGVDNLWIINADGSGLTQLTNGLDADSHPAWSPDGMKIVFSRSGEIWRINADGTNELQITDNPVEYNLEPAWSLDGGKIAFCKSLYVDTVWTMDIDGSNEILVTGSEADVLPAWSNQSDRIFFTTTRNETPSAIWVINSDGSGENSFINNNDIWWDSEPAQSPVNERLAFQSTRNGLWNIWVMTALDITDMTATPDPFSPNDDGVMDTSDIKFNLLAGGVNADLRIYNNAGNLIRTLLDQELGIVGENKVTWNGKNDYAETVVDGTYTYKITVAGSGGAGTIEKSGTVDVDTTPPSFSNWMIPDIDENTIDPQIISVTVVDISGVNTGAIQLQYGIAATADETTPTLISWTDFGVEATGTLDLNWSNYLDNYLYIRCYAEDMVGNVVYSDVQKELINYVNNPPSCEVLSPNGGEEWSGIQNISWSVIDIDGDELSITIDYSADAGLNWTNIISDLSNNGIYSWDTRTAAGDSDTYLIRIRVYDGAVWGEDQSDSNFTVDNTPPAVVMTLTATDAKISETIDLDWSGYEESDDLFYYKIYKSEADFSDVTGMSEIASAAKGTFTYRVDGLTNGISYYFAVTAVDETGNEDPNATTASAIPTGKGTIEISSNPSGTKVYFGGNYGYLGIYQGITPITIPKVLEGNHVLQINFPGYATYYQLVEVIANQTTAVTATLVKGAATEFISGARLQDTLGDLNVGSYSVPFVVDWDMDGLKDIVVANGDGDIIFYKNTGADDSPVFTTGTTILSGAGNFASAFVVDWDNDGLKDLIVGDSGGYVNLWLNSGTDSSPAFTTATPLDTIQVVGSATPFVIDWNNDTKKDLLIGDENGDLNLYLNTGIDEAPLFNTTPDFIPVSLGIGNVAPFVVTDWDRDGDKDLIIGDIDGYLNLYLNTGTDDSPAFSTGTRIQAAEENIWVGANSTPFAVDYNNDGIKDLIIGNSEGYLSLYQGREFIIPATIVIEPDVLNLGSQGKWVTGYIEFPEGYDINDIDVTTILLNDTIYAESFPVEVGDFDNDGIFDLMVKFDRQTLISLLEVGDATLTVSGELINEIKFRGSDIIRVIDKSDRN